jgi:hypothetical protein
MQKQRNNCFFDIENFEIEHFVGNWIFGIGNYFKTMKRAKIL